MCCLECLEDARRLPFAVPAGKTPPKLIISRVLPLPQHYSITVFTSIKMRTHLKSKSMSLDDALGILNFMA